MTELFQKFTRKLSLGQNINVYTPALFGHSVYIRTFIVIFQLGLTYIYTPTLLGHFL